MLQPRLVFGLGLLLLTGSASAVILQFKSKAFALHGDANRKDNVYFLNRDKENSEGYVYTTSEVGETLGLLENDWTFGSLVSAALFLCPPCSKPAVGNRMTCFLFQP